MKRRFIIKTGKPGTQIAGELGVSYATRTEATADFFDYVEKLGWRCRPAARYLKMKSEKKLVSNLVGSFKNAASSGLPPMNTLSKEKY